MSEWGRRNYGQPCRECGYDWSITREEARAVVGAFPAWVRQNVDESKWASRHPDLSWSVGSYVCHVVDNLRISAERLAGIADGADREISLYDQDLLAKARLYDGISYQAALWSLERSVRDWQEAIAMAARSEISLLHPDRGELTVDDVCRTNTHDVVHHRWDIERSLI